MARRDPVDATDTATDVGEPSAFALSRIHAEGWKVGRLIGGPSEAVAKQADRLNPYKTPIERARWRAGFDAARGRARR